MKTISIITAGLLLATSAMAQKMPKGKHLLGQQPISKQERSRELTKMLMGAHAKTANKSTATYQRMRAMSEWGQDVQNGPVVFFDSLAFTYSGMRGSSFDYNSMSIGYYDPITSPMLPGNALLFSPDVFNIYAPGLVAGYTLTYDVDDNVTEMYLDDVQGGQDERVLMTYNNSKLTYVEDLSDNGGGNWDTLYKRYFVYDVNDRLIEDSVMENQAGVWAIYQRCEYTYDVNGNITHLLVTNTDNTNSLFLPYEEDNYAYNVSDQMETATYAYYDEVNMVMALNYKDSFEYTTGFDFYTKDNYSSWDDVNLVWIYEGYMERTLNTQMKPAMAQGFEWDGTNYLPNYEEHYTYNTEGNPTHDSVYVFTNQQIDEDPVYVINYYYQDYWDLHVDRTTVKADISVYPNPVTDIMTITNSSNEAMNLQLVNALGQTVKKARTTGQGKLSIGDLTAGTYWLTVTDAKGAKLHTQAIVKQ